MRSFVILEIHTDRDGTRYTHVAPFYNSRCEINIIECKRLRRYSGQELEEDVNQIQTDILYRSRRVLARQRWQWRQEPSECKRLNAFPETRNLKGKDRR